MKPVFTTSKPGFMGSTEDYNKKFVDKFKDSEKKIFERQQIQASVLTKDGFVLKDIPKTMSVYFDGELENILGYDIPIFLEGIIENVPMQDVTVWNVEGTESYDAVLVLKEQEERITGFIVSKDQADTYKREFLDEENS